MLILERSASYFEKTSEEETYDHTIHLPFYHYYKQNPQTGFE